MKVTPGAFSRLKEKLRRQPEGIAVRIIVRNGHVHFRPDSEKNGDVVFAQGGQSLLLVGSRTAKRIADRILDVVQTSNGGRLRFVRP